MRSPGEGSARLAWAIACIGSSIRVSSALKTCWHSPQRTRPERSLELLGRDAEMGGAGRAARQHRLSLQPHPALAFGADAQRDQCGA
jgi:hypothetical protein